MLTSRIRICHPHCFWRPNRFFFSLVWALWYRTTKTSKQESHGANPSTQTRVIIYMMPLEPLMASGQYLIDILDPHSTPGSTLA